MKRQLFMFRQPVQQARGASSGPGRIIGARPAAVARRLLLLAGVLALAACARNPTGGTDFVLMSEDSELETGRELHAEMTKQNPVYDEPKLHAYVERIGQKVASISHRPDLEYTFTIIDSPDINAFALPGGFVYINRGLLAYLTTEAQLAAVLGHEIAHITARHAVRQQTAARSAGIASAVVNTALILGAGVGMGDTANMVSGALLSGYGRDMELEADRLGAEYLAKAGYPPEAMVEVITVLKNQEDFKKRTGQAGVSYHGLFATHPRNDRRLREQVGLATELNAELDPSVDPAAFREALSGLPLGRTLQSVQQQDRNRYYQNLLGYTLVLPENWSQEETPTTLTSHSPEGEGVLRVETRRLQQAKDPRLYISQDLGIKELRGAERLNQYGLSGYTGIKGDSGERLAVFYLGPRAFVITATAGTGEGSVDDESLMASIRSFRPIARGEQMIANPVKIEYIQADERTTYAGLAPYARIAEYPVDMLRLLNGDYPSGEPKPGQWVKIPR